MTKLENNQNNKKLPIGYYELKKQYIKHDSKN